MITYSKKDITPGSELFWDQTNDNHQTYTLRGTVLVRVPREWPKQERRYAITDLHPFVQGYVDAMLADTLHFNSEAKHVSFAMIHGPTLLRIMRDCAQVQPNGLDPADAAYQGMLFWVARLNGERLPFRPLTPLLTRARPGSPPRIIFGLTLGAIVGTDDANKLS